MPLALPNLDDRRYDDLVAEARALIPALAPRWTDHNASDPGITLIELFACTTEQLMFRIDRIGAAQTRAFVRLLRGPGWQPDPARPLADEVGEAVRELRRTERAVTLDDHARLARSAAGDALARVQVLARCNLEASVRDAEADAPGHVSLVLLPHAPGDPAPQPDAALLSAVRDDLEPRRLLGTRLHVVGPRYVPLGVRFALVPSAAALPSRVLADAAAALARWLDPLRGGDDGGGWPFGRAVPVSALYALLDGVPGVDHVERRRDDGLEIDELDADAARLQRNAAGDVVALRLAADELPRLHLGDGDLVVLPPGDAS